MQIDISNEDALRTFEHGVIGLIESSSLQRAEYLLIKEIRISGSDELREAVEASQDVQIEVWDELCADLLDAQRHLTTRRGTAARMLGDISRRSGLAPKAGGRPK